MIKRSILELQFITSSEPLPTVEIGAESLEVQGLYFGQIVSSTLSRFAAENPTSRATIYTYGTMSVNFHVEGWSEFLIVAGDKKVLKELNSAFSILPKVNSRYSDYIATSEGNSAFHVEDGRLWEPEDAINWYATPIEGTEKDQESVIAAPESDEYIEKGDDNALDDVIKDSESQSDDDKSDASTGGRGTEKPGRYRAARSTAKVAGICQTIEELFGLPEGSVALCGPDGRALKGNALIKTLRRRWTDV